MVSPPLTERQRQSGQPRMSSNRLRLPRRCPIRGRPAARHRQLPRRPTRPQGHHLPTHLVPVTDLRPKAVDASDDRPLHRLLPRPHRLPDTDLACHFPAPVTTAHRLPGCSPWAFSCCPSGQIAGDCSGGYLSGSTCVNTRSPSTGQRPRQQRRRSTSTSPTSRTDASPAPTAASSRNTAKTRQAERTARATSSPRTTTTKRPLRPRVGWYRRSQARLLDPLHRQRPTPVNTRHTIALALPPLLLLGCQGGKSADDVPPHLTFATVTYPVGIAPTATGCPSGWQCLPPAGSVLPPGRVVGRVNGTYVNETSAAVSAASTPQTQTTPHTTAPS